MNNRSIITRIALITAIVLTMASCRTGRHSSHLTYMEQLGDSRQGTLSKSDYKVTIQPEDELQIIVTSAIPAATSEYNLPNSNASFSTGVGNLITDSSSSHTSSTEKATSNSRNSAPSTPPG